MKIKCMFCKKEFDKKNILGVVHPHSKEIIFVCVDCYLQRFKI